MSAIYENWEKLVAAVLKEQQLWLLFHSDSVSPSISSDSSGFGFSHLISSLDDVPFASPQQDDAVVEDQFRGEIVFSIIEEPIKNGTSKPARKRNLKIEVPEIRFEDVGSSEHIVHGNIKAASILLDPNGTVKLSNFLIEKHGYPIHHFLLDGT